MNRTSLAVLFCGTALLCALPAHGLEEDRRWYISAMMSGIDADKDRGADDDFGGYHLGFGKNMGNQWSIEGTVVGARFENGSTQLARQWGVGIDLLGYFWRTDQFQPYVVGGGGYLVTDKKRGLEDEDGGMVSLGVGVKMPSFLGMEFRTEVRARRDYGGPGHLTDYLWSVGFNIPISGRRADVSKFEEGDAPGSGSPSYRFVPDTDGDGFLDPEDRCPETAGGAQVNEFGCAPSDDADGDNVPDSDDMCGDTPAGEPVDRYGCRITPPAEMSAPTDEGR
jgi:OOP family OmpA-OmpF porin